jgi:hypothetical protein
MHYPQLLKI